MPRHRSTPNRSYLEHRDTGVYSSTKRPRYDVTINFSDDDMERVQYPHEDVVTIIARICGFQVRNMMVDTGSSADVLFNYVYEKMAPKLPKKLKPYDHNLFRGLTNRQ